ncbi:MAG: RecX family transcriptional regulator [Bacteroidales bacterium]|nr:RecX family transcriptional regulator [Bacteroidales bacterium]
MASPLYSIEQAETKLQAICARSEQCSTDLFRKLRQLKFPEDDASEIISRLQEKGYIDDRRYVHAYVHDKFHLLRWGRMKIRQQLSIKGLDPDLIREGLADIDPKEYIEMAIRVVTPRVGASPDPTIPVERAKIMRFGAAKGYESAVVAEVIRAFLSKR